jgi:hypothetical protein
MRLPKKAPSGRGVNGNGLLHRRIIVC